MCDLHRQKATHSHRRERFVDLTESEVQDLLRGRWPSHRGPHGQRGRLPDARPQGRRQPAKRLGASSGATGRCFYNLHPPLLPLRLALKQSVVIPISPGSSQEFRRERDAQNGCGTCSCLVSRSRIPQSRPCLHCSPQVSSAACLPLPCSISRKDLMPVEPTIILYKSRRAAGTPARAHLTTLNEHLDASSGL